MKPNGKDSGKDQVSRIEDRLEVISDQQKKILPAVQNALDAAVFAMRQDIKSYFDILTSQQRGTAERVSQLEDLIYKIQIGTPSNGS